MRSFAAFAAFLLPETADNRVRGAKLPARLFTLIAILSFVRSCIHLFAPDGGAASIAGMDLNAGASGIVFAFALWGSAQWIYAVIQLTVAFRYRALVPLFYVLLVAETLLRMLVGHMKPVHFTHTPPGAIGNYAMLPLAVGMLALSWNTMDRVEESGPDGGVRDRAAERRRRKRA